MARRSVKFAGAGVHLTKMVRELREAGSVLANTEAAIFAQACFGAVPAMLHVTVKVGVKITFRSATRRKHPPSAEPPS
jgi:hypothetical protein